MSSKWGMNEISHEILEIDTALLDVDAMVRNLYPPRNWALG